MSEDCHFIMAKGEGNIQEFQFDPNLNMWIIGNARMDSLCAMYTLTSLLEKGYTYRGAV